MENVFEYVKPNPYPLKNNRCFGYGCIPRRRNSFCRVNRRKLNRYYRKYGFDITECWSLDCAIMSWLSDNFGGFFRECGTYDTWSDTDLNGEFNDYGALYIAEYARQNAYLVKLKDFLENDMTEDQYNALLGFVMPRLEYFRKTAFGYPGDLNGMKEWKDVLDNMQKELADKKYDLFVKWFSSLWS